MPSNTPENSPAACGWVLAHFRTVRNSRAIRETDAGGNPVRLGGNSGWYGFAEGTPYSDAANRRTASAFIRYGIANGELNPLDRYIGAGLLMSGFVPRRPHDQIGISIAMVRCGADYRADANAESHETALEFTYVLPIADRLQIQPDLQYILNPGADPGLENALVHRRPAGIEPRIPSSLIPFATNAERA